MKVYHGILSLFVLLILLVSCKNERDEAKENESHPEKNKTEVITKKEHKVLTENDKKIIGSLLTKTMQNAETKNFASTLVSVQLTTVLSKQDGPFTVFAPSNKAFKNLDNTKKKRLYNVKNKDSLILFVNTHIVEGAYDLSSLENEIKTKNGKLQLKTLAGTNLFITKKGSDIVVKDENGNTAVVGNVDVKATNGVLHVLDDLLLFD